MNILENQDLVLSILNDFENKYNDIYFEKKDGYFKLNKKNDYDLRIIDTKNRIKGILDIDCYKIYDEMLPYEINGSFFRKNISLEQREPSPFVGHFPFKFSNSLDIIDSLNVDYNFKDNVDSIFANEPFEININLINGKVVKTGKLESDKYKDNKNAVLKNYCANNLFEIYVSGIDKVLLDNNLIYFCLRIKSDDFEFCGINRDNYYKLSKYSTSMCGRKFKECDIFFITDFDGNFVFESKIYQKLYNYNNEYLIGKTFDNEFYSFCIKTHRITKLNVDDVIITLKDITPVFIQKYNHLFKEVLNYTYRKSINFEKMIKYNVIIAKKNGLYGVVSIVDSKWVVDPLYEFVYFNEEYVICYNNNSYTIYKIDFFNVQNIGFIHGSYCNIKYLVSKIQLKHVILTNLQNQDESYIVSLENNNKENKTKFITLDYFNNRYVLVKIDFRPDVNKIAYDIVDLKYQKYIIADIGLSEDYKPYYENNLIYKMTNEFLDTCVKFTKHNNVEYLLFNPSDYMSKMSVIIRIENDKYTFCKFYDFYFSKVCGKYVIAYIESIDFLGIYDIEELVKCAYIDSSSKILYNSFKDALKRPTIYELKNIPNSIITLKN